MSDQTPTTTATPQALASNGTALFIIDIQKDLAECPETKIPHAERVKKAATSILSIARQNLTSITASGLRNVPGDIIVFVQHEETPDRGPLQRGTQAWELVFEPDGEGLQAGREILVHKNTRDTFESNPHLAEELKARGISQIVACGIQSECCVQSTCLGALAAGFEVTLLRGAHSTYDIGDKPAVDVEKEVEQLVVEKGGRVSDWEGVFQYWASRLQSCGAWDMERGLSLRRYHPDS